jgi:hypothetical protein
MKAQPLIAIAAATLSLLGAGASTSFAQVQSQGQGGTTTAPSTPSQPSTAAQPTDTPAPIVVETRVDLKSGGPQSPESSQDARKEAVNALADAKTTCRRQGDRQMQRDCLKQAQDDYNAMMAQLGQGRRR